ncbi:hypothetical protein AURDEDRAFT_173607 [Auricularia subglabra TFB-10046 SS5]|uniref:Uncharacterized protein n=1 Tax=Auricularia subglabra (strain TFB-10046 / SS5) TaxID=717982 RepID=J0DAK8_AURST|nr:hypothetical protein AURDEDRAFT_173607 [Auricularia subglabra TFB-10046 SS5]
MARWKWLPGSGCARLRRFSSEMIRNLGRRGGWLLTGDSMTEAHFFALSCFLHPHVRAEPDKNTEHDYYLRAPAQSLYLAPTSPLVHTLRFPPGLDILHAPLVTYQATLGQGFFAKRTHILGFRL